MILGCFGVDLGTILALLEVGGPVPVPVAGEVSHVVLVNIVRLIAKSYSRRESDSYPK